MGKLNSSKPSKLNLSLFKKKSFKFRVSFKFHPTALENSSSPLSRPHHHNHGNHNGGRARKQFTAAKTSNPLCIRCRRGNYSFGFGNDITTKCRDRHSSCASSEVATPSACSLGGDWRPMRLRSPPRLAHAPPKHGVMELADSEGIF